MENSAGAMLGNMEIWLRCFVLVQPGTHSVLGMPTWTFIKSPGLVFIFFCIWNSCFSSVLEVRCKPTPAAPEQSREVQRHWNTGRTAWSASSRLWFLTIWGEVYPATRMSCPATSSSKLSSEAEMLLVRTELCLSGNDWFSGGAWKERRGIYI